MTTKIYKICKLPGGASGAGEWCREFCMNYGTGKCHYDPKYKRMLVLQEGKS